MRGLRERLVPGGGPAGQRPRIFKGCTHAAHEGQPQALLLVFGVDTRMRRGRSAKATVDTATRGDCRRRSATLSFCQSLMGRSPPLLVKVIMTLSEK